MAESSLPCSSGILLRGVTALLKDDTFKISSSQPAAKARKVAEALSVWIPKNNVKVSEFEVAFDQCLSKCLQSKVKSLKAKREKMWTSYHAVRTSKQYQVLWSTLLSQAGLETSPIFSQYVGNHIFKHMITKHHLLREKASTSSCRKPLTPEEAYGLRYAAGYIPRSLRKKLAKSKYPLRDDLLLCIFDLLDEGDDDKHDSKAWVESVNRGGLTLVNNPTYEVFVHMEYELRQHIVDFQVPDLDAATSAILQDEDVLFLWSMISSDWEEKTASTLLEMVVRLWMRIRGFSLASAWVEKFKVAKKQQHQLSEQQRFDALVASQQ